jgi:hypothetical protein
MGVINVATQTLQESDQWQETVRKARNAKQKAQDISKKREKSGIPAGGSGKGS